MVAHGLLEQVQQRAQAALLQRRSAAEVDQGIADGGRVEEAERLEVGQHAGMQLGQQRDIDDAATGGDVGEGELVDQDGLAGAGGAGDEIEAALEQAATQHGIEAGHPGREADERARGNGAIGHGRILLRTRAGWTSQAQQPPPPWTTRAGGPRMARIIPGRANSCCATRQHLGREDSPAGACRAPPAAPAPAWPAHPPRWQRRHAQPERRTASKPTTSATASSSVNISWDPPPWRMRTRGFILDRCHLPTSHVPSCCTHAPISAAPVHFALELAAVTAAPLAHTLTAYTGLYTEVTGVDWRDEQTSPVWRQVLTAIATSTNAQVIADTMYTIYLQQTHSRFDPTHVPPGMVAFGPLALDYLPYNAARRTIRIHFLARTCATELARECTG